MSEYLPLEIRIKQRQRLLQEAKTAAAEARKADPSDPFIYARVFSQVMNGIGVEHAKP